MDVKSFLSRNNMSQTDLAEAIGVTQATISSWAVNRTAPTILQLKRLILMGMTIGEVFDAETEAFVMRKRKSTPVKKLCSDIVETALHSLVNGKGAITDAEACRQIVKIGLEELFNSEDR